MYDKSWFSMNRHFRRIVIFDVSSVSTYRQFRRIVIIDQMVIFEQIFSFDQNLTDFIAIYFDFYNIWTILEYV